MGGCESSCLLLFVHQDVKALVSLLNYDKFEPKMFSTQTYS